MTNCSADNEGTRKSHEILNANREKGGSRESQTCENYILEFTRRGFPSSMILDVGQHFMDPSDFGTVHGVYPGNEGIEDVIESSESLSESSDMPSDRSEVGDLSVSDDEERNEEALESEIAILFSETGERSSSDENLISRDRVEILNGITETLKVQTTSNLMIQQPTYPHTGNTSNSSRPDLDSSENKTLPSLNQIVYKFASPNFQINCLTLLTTWVIEFDFFLILPLEFFHLLETLQLRVSELDESLAPDPLKISNPNRSRLVQFYASQCLSELELSYPGNSMIHFFIPSSSPCMD